MKLPQWFACLVLISSLAVAITALAWWWVVWPERTEREFLRLIADGKFDEANQMMSPSARWTREGNHIVFEGRDVTQLRFTAKEWQSWFQEPRLTRHAPSAQDYLS